MNGVINCLDHRGHGEVTRWSDDRISQAEAERVFRDYQTRFYTLADMTSGEGIIMKDFDPQVTEILAFPSMIAGALTQGMPLTDSVIAQLIHLRNDPGVLYRLRTS